MKHQFKGIHNFNVSTLLFSNEGAKNCKNSKRQLESKGKFQSVLSVAPGENSVDADSTIIIMCTPAQNSIGQRAQCLHPCDHYANAQCTL